MSGVCLQTQKFHKTILTLRNAMTSDALQSPLFHFLKGTSCDLLN